MEYLRVSTDQGLAELTLARGRVNAINERMLEEMEGCFRSLEADSSVRAVLWGGEGKFFSFGFDVPELFPRPKEAFIRFLDGFADLCAYLFSYPKPIVAALNGHAVAGGCLLALTCDYRLMATGSCKIGLNEITFGSGLPACAAEMLRFCAGARNAQIILYSGALYSAEEAFARNLVDQVCAEGDLLGEARAVARNLGDKDPVAFTSIKKLLRGPVAEEMVRLHRASAREMADIWYSEGTRRKLQGIVIRGS